MLISGQLKKLLGVVLTMWCLGQGTVAFAFVEYSVRTTYWSWDGPGGAYGVSEICHLAGADGLHWLTHLSVGPAAFELPVQATVVLAILLGILCVVVTAVLFVCLHLFIRRNPKPRLPKHHANEFVPSH